MKPAFESDVSTLDGILHALYEVLSGPAGQPRDWERYRSLFIEGARLIVVVAGKLGLEVEVKPAQTPFLRARIIGKRGAFEIA